jgi:hypothetical protein
VKTLNGGRHSLSPNETKTIAAADRPQISISGVGVYGYLYTVRTLLKVDGRVVDAVSTRTGFRKTEFCERYVQAERSHAADQKDTHSERRTSGRLSAMQCRRG